MHPSTVTLVALIVLLVAGSAAVALALVRFGWARPGRSRAPATERLARSEEKPQPEVPSMPPPPADRPERQEGDARDARAGRLRNLLLTRMSHDLRSPLNSVVTLSQLMSEGDAGALSSEQRRYVEVIHRNANTALSLFDDILDLAALESGKLELDLGVVDLAALARAAAERCGRMAQEKGVPLQVTAPLRPVAIQADADRLRHVIQRLAEHAISETRHGYVEIAVTLSDGQSDSVGADGGTGRQALLRVHDTGEDLSESTRRALSREGDAIEDLDALVLGEGSFAARDQGVLSLVVAARLAELMSLRIGVRAEDGQGVSFELRLPIVAGEVPQAISLVGAGRRILLIEDDPLERQRVAGALEGAGYVITLASSGQEGVALLRSGRFDVVVLDLVMPGMSGLDVLRTVQNDDHATDTPFVVLSALYMTRGERAVLGPRVAEVVRKGEASSDELALAVARALGVRSGQPAAPTAHPGTT